MKRKALARLVALALTLCLLLSIPAAATSWGAAGQTASEVSAPALYAGDAVILTGSTGGIGAYVDGQGGLYKAELNVYVHDGVGVLIQIAQVFSERDINVTAMSSRSGKNNTATINISFDIGGKYALNKIIDKLRSLDCVYDIARTTG